MSKSLVLLSYVLCAGLALNQWVGYFPTVQTAWNQLTAGPLPDETSMATVLAMQRSGTVPSHGAVVSVDIPSGALTAEALSTDADVDILLHQAWIDLLNAAPWATIGGCAH